MKYLYSTFIFLSVILSTGEAVPIGITLMAVIWLGGKLSGGNYNPAVSFMMFLNNKLSLHEMILYMGGQLAGAFCAYHFVTKGNKLIN